MCMCFHYVPMLQCRPDYVYCQLVLTFLMISMICIPHDIHDLCTRIHDPKSKDQTK